MKFNATSIIIKIVLGTIVILLAYFGLYANITNEIHIRKVMDERKEENIQRLEDLREIQISYKAEKGYYSNNPDSLTNFLFHYIKEKIIDRTDEDSIPANMNRWNNIQNKRIGEIINKSVEAKRIYAEMGGDWKTLTEQEKIDKGYISVNYYTAYELAFTTDYQETRNNSFDINVQNLGNIKRSYNKQKSYNGFKSEYNAYSDEVINKLEMNNIYKDIQSNFNSIFDLDTSTKISTENMKSKILDNKKEIETLKSQISDTEYNKKNAQNIIISVDTNRNRYTKDVGEKMVAKVRKKAAEKAEKGKTLRGRKGRIWSILSQQDSTEQANKIIVENCKNIIYKFENEIEAREKLILNLEKNIQSIHDVNAMQNMYINRKSVVNTNFDNLAFYTINEEIKIVTTLKWGKYTFPTLPHKWKQAQLEADFLVEQSIDEEMLDKITKEYIRLGGKYRNLTTEEGYIRGLITTVKIPIRKVIFDIVYMENRNENIILDLDNITYIPHTKEEYSFDADIKPKYKITNVLIDTLVNMSNEFQIKDIELITNIRNLEKEIKERIQKDIEKAKENEEFESFVNTIIDYKILELEEDQFNVYLDSVQKEYKKKVGKEAVSYLDKLENWLKHYGGTATTIFDELEYYEKCKIIRLLERMENTDDKSDLWSDFSISMKLDDIDPGSRNNLFFIISAKYDQIYNGLDKNEKVYQIFDRFNKEEKDLRNIQEKNTKNIQVGSLEETITDGNWGK